MPKKWIIFTICVALFILSMFYRASSAIIAPELSRDLHLQPDDLGFLGGVFFYTFALVQIPLGLLLDRFGAKMIMVLLNLMGVAGTIVFASAEGLKLGILGRALMGLGMASNLMGTLKLFTRWFEIRQFATLSGLVVSLGTLGSLAATTPLALMVQALGWRSAFFVLAGINGVFILCLSLFVQEYPTRFKIPKNDAIDGKNSLTASTALKALFSNWNYWAISLSYFLRYGSFTAIQALWIGPFLLEYLGIPTIPAGNLMLMISIGFILGSPTGGFLSDRILKSRRYALMIALSLSALCIFLLSRHQSHGFLAILGGILFFFGFFNAFGQISYAHIRELMPDAMSGTAMTGINFFSMMGAGLFIHALGAVMAFMTSGDTTGGQAYHASFLICALSLIIALALYITTDDAPVNGRGKDR